MLITCEPTCTLRRVDGGSRFLSFYFVVPSGGIVARLRTCFWSRRYPVQIRAPRLVILPAATTDPRAPHVLARGSVVVRNWIIALSSGRDVVINKPASCNGVIEALGVRGDSRRG